MMHHMAVNLRESPPTKQLLWARAICNMSSQRLIRLSGRCCPAAQVAMLHVCSLGSPGQTFQLQCTCTLAASSAARKLLRVRSLVGAGLHDRAAPDTCRWLPQCGKKLIQDALCSAACALHAGCYTQTVHNADSIPDDLKQYSKLVQSGGDNL